MAHLQKTPTKPKAASSPKSHSPYILLVEDEPTHVAVLRHTIQSANPNIVVKVAGSLKEYRSVIANSLPEIVLIDYYLPDGKALEVLISPPEAGLFPIVVMTSSGDEKLAVKAMKAGALDYIVKSTEVFKEMPHTLERALHEWNLLRECKQAEEALRESEEKFKNLFDNAIEGVYRTSPEGRLINVNMAYANMLGYESPEEVTATVTSIAHQLYANPDDRKVAIGILSEKGFLENYEIQMRKKDGDIIWVSINSRMNKSPGGEISFEGFITDITERKQAEEALSKERNLMRALIDNIPDNIYFKDIDSRFIRISKALAKKFGLSDSTQAVDKTDFDFFMEEHARPAYENEQEIIRTGQPLVGLEEKETWPDGRETWVLTTKMPLRDEKGNIIGTFGISRDITERKRAEEELRKSEGKFRAIFDNANDGMFLVDLKAQKFFICNAMCAKMLGYAQEEFSNLDIADIHTGEDLPFIYEQLGKFSRGEEGIGSEIRFKRKDGSIFAADLTPSLLTLAEKKYLLIIFKDITERKQMEELLDNERNLLRVLIDTLPDKIYVKDCESRFIVCNKATATRLGASNPAEVIGKSDFDFLPHELAARFHDDEQEIIKSGKSLINHEEPLDQLSGTTRWNLVTKVPFYDQQGNIRGIVGTGRDITEQKQVERTLRENEHFFRLLFTTSPDSILIFDPFSTTVPWEILDCNEVACRMNGYTREELIGKSVDMLNTKISTLEEREAHMKRLQQEGVIHFETLHRHQDGHIFPIEVASSIVTLGGRQLILGIDRNITERKQTEEAVRQMQKMEGLGTLAGGIAHDFNNILGIILAYITSVKRSKDDTKKLDLATETITKAVDRGKTLVQQILTFARKTETSFGAVNVNDVIMEIMTMILETFPKILTYAQNFEKGLPYINADRTQLYQALLNLCVNARDAMPNGGLLAINTRMVPGSNVRIKHPDVSNNNYVCIEVSDTGEGMTEEVRKRIFEPFFTTKGIGKGTGLGLSVVFGVVQTHNGFVDVESEIGKGTTFRLYLPVVQALEPIIEKEETLEEISGGTETLLVVEDEEMLLTYLQFVLVEKGYKVITAGDGQTAIKIYQERKNDIALVLTDLGLPNISGLEVCQRIKKINPNERMILATGFLDPEMKSEFLKAGIQHFLYKPYDLTKVLKEVRAAIDGK